MAAAISRVRGDTVPPIRGKVFRWRPKHPDREWRKLMPRNNMSNNARFAEVASLAGDPARVGMLHALMDGRALTASELARVASVTPRPRAGTSLKWPPPASCKSKSRAGIATTGLLRRQSLR